MEPVTLYWENAPAVRVICPICGWRDVCEPENAEWVATNHVAGTHLSADVQLRRKGPA